MVRCSGSASRVCVPSSHTSTVSRSAFQKRCRVLCSEMRHRFTTVTTCILGTIVLTAFGFSVEGEAQQLALRAEHAQYRVGWGIFRRAGSAQLTTTYDTLRGKQVMHAVLAIRGGIPGARVDERLESWIDPYSLASYRFTQRTRYPRFKRDRVRDFFGAERRWTGHTNDRFEAGDLPTDRPLDELSFIFVARHLDFSTTSDVTIGDYWRAESNPVRFVVLRRDTVTVPAGTFSTIVVRPVIRTSSLFAENGEAELHFSDSPDRELVMLRAKVSIGTLVLQLEKFTKIQDVHPAPVATSSCTIGRKRSASPMCARVTDSTSSRSAIVRAIRNTR